jgi:hypothetical protein
MNFQPTLRAKLDELVTRRDSVVPTRRTFGQFRRGVLRLREPSLRPMVSTKTADLGDYQTLKHRLTPLAN